MRLAKAFLKAVGVLLLITAFMSIIVAMILAISEFWGSAGVAILCIMILLGYFTKMFYVHSNEDEKKKKQQENTPAS